MSFLFQVLQLAIFFLQLDVYVERRSFARHDAPYRSDASFHRLRQRLSRFLVEFSPFRNLRKAARSRIAASCKWQKDSESWRQASRCKVDGGSRVAINTSAASRRTSQCTSNKLSAPVITLRLRDLRVMEEERYKSFESPARLPFLDMTAMINKTRSQRHSLRMQYNPGPLGRRTDL